MGVLGLDGFGKAIAARAQAFGLNILYHSRHMQPDSPYQYVATPIELARRSDILMIAAPGGPATRHIVGAETLEALGPQGVLVNIARGSLVDQDALVEALEQGKILTAALDVFEDEPNAPARLKALDHVVLTPHVGSGSAKTRAAMWALVVDNLLAYVEGEGPLTPVAETPWPRKRT